MPHPNVFHELKTLVLRMPLFTWTVTRGLQQDAGVGGAVNRAAAVDALRVCQHKTAGECSLLRSLLGGPEGPPLRMTTVRLKPDVTSPVA